MNFAHSFLMPGCYCSWSYSVAVSVPWLSCLRQYVASWLAYCAADYRLNYKLNKECFHDVEMLCVHACDKLLEAGSQTCGGTVLKCLSENVDKLKSKACKDEVFYFQKREVADIQLDVPLQQACKEDLAQLCPSVSKDYAKTLSCLRNDRDALSPECKDEELRFSTMEVRCIPFQRNQNRPVPPGLQSLSCRGILPGSDVCATLSCSFAPVPCSCGQASDIRLTPTLMNACGLELQHFCRGVPPGGGKSFRCLQMNVEEVSCSLPLCLLIQLIPFCSFFDHSPLLWALPFLLAQLCCAVLAYFGALCYWQMGMGIACKAEVNLQTLRESSYYRLDTGLKMQCEADVAKLCEGIDEGQEGHALVLKCLVDHHSQLAGPCQTEVRPLSPGLAHCCLCIIGRKTVSVMSYPCIFWLAYCGGAGVICWWWWSYLTNAGVLSCPHGPVAVPQEGATYGSLRRGRGDSLHQRHTRH